MFTTCLEIRFIRRTWILGKVEDYPMSRRMSLASGTTQTSDFGWLEMPYGGRLKCIIRRGNGLKFLLRELSTIAHHLCGKVHQFFDQAGRTTNLDFDFKGNLISSQ
jgi:hypothetical protein